MTWLPSAGRIVRTKKALADKRQERQPRTRLKLASVNMAASRKSSDDASEWCA